MIMESGGFGACFTATGLRHLAVIESTKNCSLFKASGRQSVWLLQLVWTELSNSSNRIAEKEKNQGAAMVQSKSKPQRDWNAVEGR